ncbi:efflux RND transporter periplasmic adaptor subunit [Vagococcus sp. WN89Y]|uniref:efflux RND transporter periplasmic adaptor subunit n=1 Tax=Vagococcus sp. WN89Y TaxID=3457258 RepID=UPI003FCD004E
MTSTLTSRLKKHKPWLLLLAASSFGLLVAMLLHGCGGQYQEQAPPPRPVKFMVVPPPSSQDAQQRVGEIHAHDEVALGFRVGGRLITRAVDVGARVKAGQVLASLESKTTDNELLAASASLDSARAEERVSAANLRRMKQLMPSGAIAIAELDKAQAEWQAAAAKRKSAEASLRIAKENVDWSQLISPADGIITTVSASVGQVLSAGQNVATLAAGDARDAVFDIASPDELHNPPAKRFRVSLLASPAVQSSALFRDISPQADSKTRTWRVRLTLQSPPSAMAPGVSVQAALGDAGPPVIALPASALTRSGSLPAVFIIDEQRQQLALAPVVLSSFSPTHIFVSRGLAPGNKVVTAGVIKLRAGEKVPAGEASE